jgi:hypothetical protein
MAYNECAIIHVITMVIVGIWELCCIMIHSPTLQFFPLVIQDFISPNDLTIPYTMEWYVVKAILTKGIVIPQSTKPIFIGH